MTPFYTDDSVTLYHGDCLDVLRELPDASVDSVVTDPPYGLEFMGREWDAPWKGDVRQRGDDTFDAADDSKPFGRIRHGGTAAYGASAAVVGAAFQAWCTEWAAECLRVLKPGGHMLAFGGSRTWHRLTCAVEDAGFEIRDSVAWLHSQGFPKSMNVNKDPRFCHCREGESDGAEGTEPQTEHGVRSLLDADVPATEGTARGARSILLKGVQEHGSSTAGRPELSAAQDGISEPSVEGRRDVPQGEGQLRRPPVRPMPTGVPANGTEGRLHHGTPPSDGSVDGPLSVEDGGREPHQSRPKGQQAGELGAVSVERGPQASGVWPLCGGCGKPEIPAGLGTALKPAFEPIVVARKPLAGTVAANVLAYGTGALNIAACRVTASDQSPDSSISHDSDGSSRADNTACTCPSHEGDQTTHTLSKPRQGTSDDVHEGHSDPPANAQPSGNGHRPLPDSLDGYQSLSRSGDEPAHAATGDGQASALPPLGAGTSPDRCATCGGSRSYPSKPYPDSTAPNVETRAGRWPSNVVLDDSQATELDRQSGTIVDRNGGRGGWRTDYVGGDQPETLTDSPVYRGEGGASRFFPTFRYEPKAPTTERPRENGTAHPTVKPLDLMRWLVRLVTPPGGTVLEPFAGSGTTAEACVVEGFKCVAVEREADYLPLIVQRLTKPIQVALDFDSLT